MPVEQNYFLNEQVPIAVPIWREGFIGVDWLALRYSPVYYGLGVPRGDGSAVVLVPGFLANDSYLQEMYWWLRRIGYKPYMSNIGRNANCISVLSEKLLKTVERAYQDTDRKVHLIGHSLGGVLSRSITTQRPEMVASVITLASPFRGLSSHPFVMRAADSVRARVRNQAPGRAERGCFTGACSCAAATALREGLAHKIPRTAIYTKTDGIVDWQMCVNADPATNFEVLGTHGGLAFNPMVYRVVANRLAQIKNK